MSRKGMEFALCFQCSGNQWFTFGDVAIGGLFSCEWCTTNRIMSYEFPICSFHFIPIYIAFSFICQMVFSKLPLQLFRQFDPLNNATYPRFTFSCWSKLVVNTTGAGESLRQLVLSTPFPLPKGPNHLTWNVKPAGKARGDVHIEDELWNLKVWEPILQQMLHLGSCSIMLFLLTLMCGCHHLGNTHPGAGRCARDVRLP